MKRDEKGLRCVMDRMGERYDELEDFGFHGQREADFYLQVIAIYSQHLATWKTHHYSATEQTIHFWLSETA